MSAGAYRCDLLPRQLPTRLRHGNSARKFAQIDSYVHQRLAIFASVKHGLHGRNWQRRFTWAWLKALGVYRLSGRVRSGAAHALR
jgi:RNA-directed DNA polymerase